MRTAVGINEIHNFGKYEVSGAGAEAFLDRIMAGRLPREGRMALSPMLAESGRLMGDFSIMRLAPDRFQLTASYAAQAYHTRWFDRHLPEKGVTLRNVSRERLGFQIAGPRARELLGQVAEADMSNAAFPFLSVREMEVGGIDAIVARVSYTGDLGYEIYVPAEQQVALYEVLAAAGADLGLRPFGMRAMMSLRLEKGFGAWMREYKPDYTPVETGLDRFVDYGKADFIGRASALKERDDPPARRLCSFVVDAADADAVAWEPIWKDGAVVGYVTSGGYAHHVGKSVALGFVPVDMIADGAAFEIEILGELRRATLIAAPLFDPKGARMRG